MSSKEGQMKNIVLGKWFENAGQLLHCSECGSTIMGGIAVEAVKGEVFECEAGRKSNIIPDDMRLFSDSELAGEPKHREDSVFVFFKCQACKQLLMLFIRQLNGQIFVSIDLAAEEEQKRAKA